MVFGNELHTLVTGKGQIYFVNKFKNEFYVRWQVMKDKPQMIKANVDSGFLPNI